MALNKPTAQSSTHSGGVPSRAVDGNTKSNWGDNTCTHTDGINPSQWWRVDLQQRVAVEKVNLKFDRGKNMLVDIEIIHRSWVIKVDVV